MNSNERGRIKPDRQPISDEGPPEYKNSSALLGKLMWILVGPLALTIAGLQVVRSRGEWFVVFDAALGAIAGLIILRHWLEQRSIEAVVVEEAPATLECHRAAYVRKLLLTAVAAWASLKRLNRLFLVQNLTSLPVVRRLGPVGPFIWD